MDSLHLTEVCFADDVLVVSHSLPDLERMMREAMDAFQSVGLDVEIEKTHWTSWPAQPGVQLQVGDSRWNWEPSLVLLVVLWIFLATADPR